MKFFIWRTYTLLSPLLPILPGPPARKDFIFGSGNNICLHFIWKARCNIFPLKPASFQKKILFWNALKLISLQEWFGDGTLTADVACFWKELNSHSIQSIYVYNYSRHAQPSHYVIAISETSVMNPPHHEFMTSKWSKYAALKECEARTLSKGKDGLGRPLSFIGGERLCCSICSAYGGLTSPFTYPCRRPGRLDRHWNQRPDGEQVSLPAHVQLRNDRRGARVERSSVANATFYLPPKVCRLAGDNSWRPSSFLRPDKRDQGA